MEEIKFIESEIDNLKRCLNALTKMGDTYMSVTPFRILMTKRKIEKFEKVKQDLEVLEIIRKKKVEVLPLWYIIKTNEEKDNEYILMKYNERFGNQMYELTMEELLKLKQWLEGNENVG